MGTNGSDGTPAVNPQPHSRRWRFLARLRHILIRPDTDAASIRTLTKRKECELVIECRLIKTVELGLHTMFIGEIIDVKANEEILGENGSPVPEKHRPFIWSVGGYGFYGLGGRIGSVGDLAKKYME